MPVTFHDLSKAFRNLNLPRTQPVIAHASLSAFGQVVGGADTVLGAMLSAFNTLIMPVFTYKTMVIPESGPTDNGLTYGSGKDTNRMSEFFTPDMPADRLMGIIPETLRRNPRSQRSTHPILSFTGVNAAPILEAQTLQEPLAPIRLLADGQGWVLLLGVDHTANTSLHFAEKLTGRKQFVRWALTPQGIVECPGWPGCSDGFQAIAPQIESITRKTQAGAAVIQAIPLPGLIDAVSACLQADPLFLLCERSDCERCNAIRKNIVS